MVTRPSWHQGGAFTPSPTGHKGSTNNWRLWCPESCMVPRRSHCLQPPPPPPLGRGWRLLTWVSVKLSRACITDCSGLEAWDYKRETKSVFSVGLEQVMGKGPYVLGVGGRALCKGQDCAFMQ